MSVNIRTTCLLAFFAALILSQAANAKQPVAKATKPAKAKRTNVVLCMADDQGWSEIGYNDHEHLKTPVMDTIAREGFRFDRFYAAPNCGPTRGAIMTGRNSARFGQFGPTWAMRPEEITLGEIFKAQGYATAHYGKWHLGPVKAAAPNCPGNQGFDEWLSHDNYFEIDPPLSKNGAPPEIYKGEGSEIIVDEAIRFIKKSVAAEQPFLTVVWFGSCHGPQIASDEDRKPYMNIDSPIAEKLSHRYGEIAAMDRALGKLRDSLRELDIHRDTILWYCSDNGEPSNSWYKPPFNGSKGNMFEGGIRVPSCVEWPNGIKNDGSTSVICEVADLLPTICDWLDFPLPKNRILDGISLVPLVEGKMKSRPKPIGICRYGSDGDDKYGPWMDFDSQTGTTPVSSNPATQFLNMKHAVARTKDFPGDVTWIDNRFKLLLDEVGRHKDKNKVITPTTGVVSLFDILIDPEEKHNIASDHPEIVERMTKEVNDWRRSIEFSLTGAEYK